jgi:alpha-galactosidase
LRKKSEGRGAIKKRFGEIVHTFWEIFFERQHDSDMSDPITGKSDLTIFETRQYTRLKNLQRRQLGALPRARLFTRQIPFYLKHLRHRSCIGFMLCSTQLFRAFVVLVCVGWSSSFTQAMTNGLALTPPMGYNSWYANGTNISDSYLRSIADTMVSNGMRDAGYQYLNIDDGWAGYRDTNGVIVADTNKFPYGMKALIDYVHADGLKFGIYTVEGTVTCAGLPGSYGHVVQDANTFASWGVDYLKYEGCSFPDPLDNELPQCELMGNALKNCGRPIVFTMSTGPFESWFPGQLNMWRGTGDFNPDWSTLMAHIAFVSQSAYAAGPGGWNDPDVLGTGFLDYTDDQAIFSMWCILASPLLAPIIGYNGYTNTLCNTEAISVDQDAAGIQGTCVASNGQLQVWCKPLGSANGMVKAVALFNSGETNGTITANWSDIGLPPGPAAVRDLWAHQYAGVFTNSYTATLAPHGINLVKIYYGATVPLRPVGTNFLSDLDWLPSSTNPYAIGQDQATGGTPLLLHGVQYAKGLGAHAVSHIQFPLQGATRFHSDIGVDDGACCGVASIIFNVSMDGTNLYNSGVMTSSSPTQTIDVSVAGGDVLTLDVTNGVSGNVSDHADWAGAYILMPPAPMVNSFVVNGSSVVINGIHGATNSIYYVLATSNPGLPPSQWNIVATNYFDAYGNFSFTNMSTASSMFFLLEMP